MLFVLHALWTPITIILFVLLARPRSNPLANLAEAILTATSTRGGRLILFLAVLVIGINFVECIFEPAISGALGYDLTAWVRSVEGATVERVQATLPKALVPALGWFYLSGYIATLVAPAVVWTAEGRWRPVAALATGFGANYALGVFFYFFFPVREVAWSGLSNAAPLLEALFPGISAETRMGSALDNCFPSLHVSMTCTVFFVALTTKDVAVKRMAGIAAALTAYAVMALGIHWALDVVSGVLFAGLCAGIGIVLGPRLWKRNPATAS